MPVHKIKDIDVGVHSIRALLWAGLQDKHPQFSVKQVGSLIKPDNFRGVTATVLSALLESFGLDDFDLEAEVEGKKKRPRGAGKQPRD